MLAPAAPFMLDWRRSGAGRSVWATLTAAALAGIAFTVGVLVQRPINAGPPPQATVPFHAAEGSFGNVIEQAPPKVLRTATVAPGGTSPSVPIAVQPDQAIHHRHWYRVKNSLATPPTQASSCDGRSSLFPQGDEVGPVSSITGPLSEGLPSPLGGDGGVVTETSCAVASLGG